MHTQDFTGTTDRFFFSSDNIADAEKIVGRYPKGREASALIPLLQIAQRQNGNWLSRAAMDYVADLLRLPPIHVYEVATFYTMFNLAPVGKYVIQFCRTTACWLMGGDSVKDICRQKLGVEVGQTTPDGMFTLQEVECIGACANGPAIKINDDTFEDLDAASMAFVLDELLAGRMPKAGSQKGRQGAAPWHGKEG